MKTGIWCFAARTRIRQCYVPLTTDGLDSNVECSNPTHFQLNEQGRTVVQVYGYTYLHNYEAPARVQSGHLQPIEAEVYMKQR